jgi:hypothetical protein
VGALLLSIALWLAPEASAQPVVRPGPDSGAVDCNETALLTPCDALEMSSQLAPPPSLSLTPTTTGVGSITSPNSDFLCSPSCLQPLATCGGNLNDGTAALVRLAIRTCDATDAQEALGAACASSFRVDCTAETLCTLECTTLVDDGRSCGAKLDISDADLGGFCTRSPGPLDCLKQLSDSQCFGDDLGQLLPALRALSSILAANEASDGATTTWTSSGAFCTPSCIEVVNSDCGSAAFGENAGAVLSAHCSACLTAFDAACGGTATLWPSTEAGEANGVSMPEGLKEALESPLWRVCAPACSAFLSDSTECVDGSAELGAAAADVSASCSDGLTGCISDVRRDCGIAEPGAELSSGLCSPSCQARLLNQSDSCYALLAGTFFGMVDLEVDLPQVCCAVVGRVE